MSEDVSTVVALLFFVATLWLLIAALPRNGRVRRWFRGRQAPRRAVGLLFAAWLVTLVTLGAVFPDPATTGASTDGQAAEPAPAGAAAPATARQQAADDGDRRNRKPAPAPVPSRSIARIIDGDTVQLDDGRRVRLLGVDSPEAGTVCGEEAETFMARFDGQPVTVTFDPNQDRIDRYGRTLAYLATASDEDLSVALAYAGHAAYFDVGVPVRKKREIVAAVRAAAGRGDACLSSEPTATPEPPREPRVQKPDPGPSIDDLDLNRPYRPLPAPDVDPQPRSEGKPGCNPLTARDGDGDGIVCEL